MRDRPGGLTNWFTNQPALTNGRHMGQANHQQEPSSPVYQSNHDVPQRRQQEPGLANGRHMGQENHQQEPSSPVYQSNHHDQPQRRQQEPGLANGRHTNQCEQESSKLPGYQLKYRDQQTQSENLHQIPNLASGGHISHCRKEKTQFEYQFHHRDQEHQSERRGHESGLANGGHTSQCEPGRAQLDNQTHRSDQENQSKKREPGSENGRNRRQPVSFQFEQELSQQIKKLSHYCIQKLKHKHGWKESSLGYTAQCQQQPTQKGTQSHDHDQQRQTQKQPLLQQATAEIALNPQGFNPQGMAMASPHPNKSNSAAMSNQVNSQPGQDPQQYLYQEQSHPQQQWQLSDQLDQAHFAHQYSFASQPPPIPMVFFPPNYHPFQGQLPGEFQQQTQQYVQQPPQLYIQMPPNQNFLQPQQRFLQPQQPHLHQQMQHEHVQQQQQQTDLGFPPEQNPYVPFQPRPHLVAPSPMEHHQDQPRPMPLMYQQPRSSMIYLPPSTPNRVVPPFNARMPPPSIGGPRFSGRVNDQRHQFPPTHDGHSSPQLCIPRNKPSPTLPDSTV